MIRMPTLEQAREEARLLSARGYTVYVYRMRHGGYWLDQLPPRLVKLEFIEKIETERAIYRRPQITAAITAAAAPNPRRSRIQHGKAFRQRMRKCFAFGAGFLPTNVPAGKFLTGTGATTAPPQAPGLICIGPGGSQ